MQYYSHWVSSLEATYSARISHLLRQTGPEIGISLGKIHCKFLRGIVMRWEDSRQTNSIRGSNLTLASVLWFRKFCCRAVLGNDSQVSLLRNTCKYRHNMAGTKFSKLLHSAAHQCSIIHKCWTVAPVNNFNTYYPFNKLANMNLSILTKDCSW